MKNATSVLWLVMLLGCPALAQKRFTDSLTISTYLSLEGERIEVVIDSVYMMNPLTYRTYTTALQAVKKKQNLDQQIMALQAKELDVLKQRMLEQRQEFQDLNAVTQNLLSTGTGFVNRTDLSLSSINQQLIRTSDDLAKAQISLDAALDAIKAEKKSRWKIFGRGFITGALASTLVFILVK